MSERLRVLVIEDNQGDADLIREALPETGPVGFHIEAVSRLSEALTRLKSGGIDIIVLDLGLPDSQGLETFHRLREATSQIPVIILTGTDNQGMAITAVREGAQDYLVKGQIGGGQLTRTMRYAVERKKTEDELRQMNAFLNSVVENIPNMIFLKDAENLRFVRFNRAGEDLLGYSRNDLLGKNDYDFFPKEQADFFTEKDRDVLCGKEVVDIPEESLQTRNKGNRILHTKKVPIMNEKGDPKYLLGISEDITEQKRSEEALIISEARFRSIIDVSPVSMALNDEQQHITFLNPAFIQTFGYTQEDIPSLANWWTNAYPDLEYRQWVADTWQAELEHAKRTGTAFSPMELTVRCKNGTSKTVLASAASISKSFGDNHLVVLYDITERKKAEEDLKETLESLRKAVGTTIQVMVTAVETRDPYTAGHQLRVADLAGAIATEMGLSKATIEAIRMASPIHDIGKLSIPAEILSKPTKLPEIEFALIKEHARQGYEMLKDVASPWPLAEIVYQHHERMDGSGYPRNLKGEEILMEARILAVADVVESMASHRPYRPALGLDVALEEIENNKGTLYDADVVDACLRLFREKGFQLEGSRL